MATVWVTLGKSDLTNYASLDIFILWYLIFGTFQI